MAHLFSKSGFMNGYQCPKRLYLYKNKYNLRDEISDAQQTVFSRGTEVGELAQQLFPNGVNAKPNTPFEYEKSARDTQRYIKEGHTVIYEAAFIFEGVLAAVDILVKTNDEWIAYEVKSSTSVKEPYITDTALQYHVITKSGVPLKDIFVVYINNEYVRVGDLQIEKLFAMQSVLTDVIGMQNIITTKIISSE